MMKSMPKKITISIGEVKLRSKEALELALNSNFSHRVFQDKRYKKPKHKLRDMQSW